MNNYSTSNTFQSISCKKRRKKCNYINNFLLFCNQVGNCCKKEGKLNTLVGTFSQRVRKISTKLVTSAVAVRETETWVWGVPEIPWRYGLKASWTWLIFIFGPKFDDFSKWWSAPMVLLNFENSLNTAQIWQNMKKSHVQRAFNPFLGWFRGSTRSTTNLSKITLFFWTKKKSIDHCVLTRGDFAIIAGNSQVTGISRRRCRYKDMRKGWSITTPICTYSSNRRSHSSSFFSILGFWRIFVAP